MFLLILWAEYLLHFMNNSGKGEGYFENYHLLANPVAGRWPCHLLMCLSLQLMLLCAAVRRMIWQIQEITLQTVAQLFLGIRWQLQIHHLHQFFEPQRNNIVKCRKITFFPGQQQSHLTTEIPCSIFASCTRHLHLIERGN